MERLNYRISTHSTTLVSPAEALYRRKIRGKIPTIDNKLDWRALRNLPHRDYASKQKIKSYVDKRYNAKDSHIVPEDYVLVKQHKRNKLSSKFDPTPYHITERRGTMLTASRPEHSITRNIQHFKFLSTTEPRNFSLGGEEEDLDIEDEQPKTVQNELQQKKYPRRENRRRPNYFHEDIRYR